MSPGQEGLGDESLSHRLVWLGHSCPRLLILNSRLRSHLLSLTDDRARPAGHCRTGMSDSHGPVSPDRAMFIRHRQDATFSGKLPYMTSQTLASTLEGFLS